jgi:hypothetical protein
VISKKISLLSNAIVFVFATIIIGLLSFTNLVNFYVNEETDYNEWTADLGNKFETDVATTFFEKFQFINLNGAGRNILGQREMNGVVKLMNGHLIIPQEKMADEQIKAYADEVIKYASFCKAQGKPFLFVQPNLKVDKDNKQLPTGIEDYSNENIDIFLQYLRDANIEVLDIRDCMKEEGFDLYEYTYVTDHHWTTEGGFYAFSKIAEWLEKETGVTANPIVTNIDNYEITTYNKWHLGSYGQRVGEYFTGIDDYDLIVPSFDVSFVDEDGNSHSFYDQAVNTSVFEIRDAKSRYTYDWAIQIPEGVATTSQELSVLLVSDSYSKAVAPYMKLAYSEYYYQYYPDGFYVDSVTNYAPDVVILMPFYTSTFYPGAVYKK